jgi:competence protein ComEA
VEEETMTIEDFEWEGEVEVTQRRREPATAEPSESWLKRLRKSVWLEPALRLGGMAALLGVLSVIGAVATTYAKPGLKLPDGPRALADVLGTSWLKPSPAEKDEHAPARAAAPLSQIPAVLPTPSAASAAAAGAPGVPPVATAGAVLADGRIVLNAASAEELTKLPGVGMKRAEAIVALRTKLKRFRQATDLLRVKGIGPRSLKRMLPHLVLDPP